MAIFCELRDIKRDVRVATVRATNIKEAKEYWEFYLNNLLCNCKVFVIGRAVNNRVILSSDLTMLNHKELMSIPDRMLSSLINKDFSNDNTTFFMLERGLVTDSRDQLSAKGEEIYSAWEKVTGL